MSYNTISERLKARRIELGYSLDQLSEITGYAKTTLHRYENDANSNLRIDKIEHLAKCLDVSSAYLIGRESMEVNVDDFTFLTYIFDQISLPVSYDEIINKYFIYPEEVLYTDDELYWEEHAIVNDDKIEKIYITPKEIQHLKNEIISFGEFKILSMLKNKTSTHNRDFKFYFKNNKIDLNYDIDSHSSEED